MRKLLLAFLLIPSLAYAQVQISGSAVQIGGNVPGAGGGQPGYGTATQAAQIVLTDSTYNASPNGLTTTTTSGAISPGSTSVAVGSCSTFNANNGILIGGNGGAWATNTPGKVVTCTGTTLTFTPAATNSVASAATVQHEESAAFTAAKTYAETSNVSVHVWLNDGVYRCSILNDTSGENACIQTPKTIYTGNQLTYEISGFTDVHGDGVQTSNNGAMLLTDLTSGNLIGGYNAASSGFGPFTNVRLAIRNLFIDTPSGHWPNIELINMKWIASMDLEHLQLGTLTGCTAGGTGVGIETPSISSDAWLRIDDVGIACGGTGIIVGEHDNIGSLYLANLSTAIVADPRTFATANSAHIAYAWCFLTNTCLASGTEAMTINIDNFDIEHPTGSTQISDAGNLLYGRVNYHVPYAWSPVTVYAIVTSGAANLQLHNLTYPSVACTDGNGSGALSGICNFYNNSSTADASITHPANGVVGITPRLRLISVASDPVSPANGDMWYNSTANQFKFYQNGAIQTFGGSLSGMTAGQVPIAASATTVTSSKALAGTGLGISTGPTSTTTNNCVKFGDSSGTLADAGAPCGTGSGGGVGGNGLFSYTPPTLANFTWVNQGSCTAVSNASTIFMSCPTNGSADNLRAMVENVPSSPYTITMWFSSDLVQMNYLQKGLTLYDGTKFLNFAVQNNSNICNPSGTTVHWGIGVDLWNNTTTYGSNLAAQCIQPVPWIGLRINVVSGGNDTYYYSKDGVNWIQFFQEADHAHITQTKVGYYMNPNSQLTTGTGVPSGGFGLDMTIASWTD